MGEQVFLSRCPGYELERLEELVGELFCGLGVYEELKPGMLAVVKPNLVIKAKPEEAVTTHPNLVAAVGRCLKKAGARVLIAESPGGPYTPAVMKSIFAACGYPELAKREGFELYTACKSREVSLPDGKRCRRMTVLEPFLDGDYIVNLAKLKTHCMLDMSGAVKNLFGAVPGLMKPELHCRFPEREAFAEMIVDLCELIRPQLSVIDAVEAMQGNGPTGGEKRFVGALVASKSPYAADLAAASLIGFSPMELPLLRNAADRGLCPQSLAELDMRGGAPLEALRVPDFKRAESSSTDFLMRLPAFLRPFAKKVTTPAPKIRTKDCVGCGKCAESCPRHTIRIREKKAEIHYQECIRCFCCHEMCPKRAIDIRRLGLFNL